MFDLLYHYFIQNRSLSLPGIGTFDLFHVSPQTDFTNKKILAPTFSVSFNRIHDTPAKNLFQYISGKMNLPEWEAIKAVNDFSQDLKHQLRSGQEITWQGIGVLKPDVSGDISFEPERIKYDFIPNVNAERVIRPETEHRIMVGDHEIKRADIKNWHYEEAELEIVEAKAGWWMYAVLLAAIALVAIFFRLYSNGFGFSDGMHKKVKPAETQKNYRITE
jgi:hypothetical protein